MAGLVTKAVNLKSQMVNFSENIKTNKYNGKSVYVNYNGNPLRVQMPKMSLPFGINKYINPDKPEEIKYSLEMSFKDVNPVVLEQLHEIENKTLDFVEKNSKELFKKQMSREVVAENYKSSIKYGEDENGDRDLKYAPRLKAKIYTDGANFRVDTFDSVKVDNKYQKIHINEDNVDDIITKGSSCEAILSCSGIWVVGKTFGVSWVLSQLKIYKNENTLNGYAFQDDEEEEEEEKEEKEENFDEEEPSNVVDSGTSDVEEEVEKLKITEAPAKKTRRKKELF